MQRISLNLTRFGQTLIIVVMALIVYFSVHLVLGERPAHALPEYAPLTGEPCATCHVSAGGGGPRTLRGMLWTARGRPDEVPKLPGNLIAPGVESGVELYDIACAGCHGRSGEGLFGISLAERGISQPAARSFIRNGIPELGMPAFGGQFTVEQLDALSQFVADMSQGEAPPEEYPLSPPVSNCTLTTTSCGGN